MKKLLITVVGLMFCLGLATNAAQKNVLTPEQQAAKKELMEKYDTDKNGKLDKEERAKMTAEDKQKLAGLGPAKKPAKK